MSDKLEQLFERALQLPRDARPSFIAEACAGDDTMRAELTSLVTAAEAAGNFFARLGSAALSPPVLAEAVDHAVGSPSDSPYSESRMSEVALPSGTIIDRYRIVERLGRGGMGTVYRAQDTRLDREVALKFLSPHLISDPEAGDRLLAEARAAASLQHPNICVVHEIGETSDGQRFIAMELLEGETLKKRIASGPMSADDAVAIAAQIARALGAAHARHIIHRDVKPGNVIITNDGTAKLLDFGLAKSADVTVSRPGSTPGTVAYMSPEQVRGDHVDHRSDLWSLGVVLYEMIAGRRPFRGGSDRVILQAILHEDPGSLPGAGNTVPSHVDRVVQRLLSKDPVARYDSASVALGELVNADANDHQGRGRAPRRIRTNQSALLVGGAAILVATVSGVMAWSSRNAGLAIGATEPSIAVLPLRSLSADSLDASLATGMTEELIATLARNGGVRVIASTSTSGFKGREIDIRQIADSLGVATVLEGGIQKSGSQLRVEVRLVRGRDGSTIWSQAYDREFKDMFTVQDQIVRTVAGELGLRFDKDRQLSRHRTRSIAAYELYLRASDPLLVRSQTGVWKAKELFEQAIKADSTYAAAHAGLALVQVRRGRTMGDPGMPPREIYALAEASARKAIALDASLPEAHYALGRVKEVMLDFPAAEAAIRRAIALDPTRSIYRRSLSTLHGWASRPEEELAEARIALETDPLNPYAHVAMSSGYFANRRFEESLVQLDRVAAMKPPLQAVAFVRAQDYNKLNRVAEAIAALRPQAEAGDPMFQGLLGYMLARSGQRDEANQILADLLARNERTRGGAFQVAMVHAGFGDLDQTFEWLDKSIDDQSISSMIMGPTFEDLRRDPRFEKLRERLGLDKR
jgi:TolB-like protein/tetratricopeptide (TPR) repeat protein